ncbi:MAG TPA: sigma 54-interacting transcriptional regulator [Symbiobacteriaceae bacterium]|jgi:PAS domain S-box-containing protein
MDLPQASVAHIMTRRFRIVNRTGWPPDLQREQTAVLLLEHQGRVTGAAMRDNALTWIAEHPGMGPDVYAWQPVSVVLPTMPVMDFATQLGSSVAVVVEADGTPMGVLLGPELIWYLAGEYRKLAARFDTAINTVDESVSMVNEDGHVIVWNRAAQRLFDIEPAAILGRPLAEFFPSRDQWSLRALATGISVHHALHEPRPGTWVFITSAPVRLGDRIVGALAVEQNMTQLVNLNEQLYRTTSEVKALQGVVAQLRQHEDPFEVIRGRGVSIQKAIALAHKVAASDASVLVRGESGVGKELFAKAIHDASERRDKPFIAINCGAIPAGLFESELFGYEKGAFTGADQKGKSGKLEQAQGGTLFLDEVGELPMEAQVKLLRVLQDRRFYRLGSDKPRIVDLRIIAATNRNLDDMLRQGSFREDLYFRLDVVSLEVPPLRDRLEDMAELVHDFVQEFALRYKKPINGIEPDVMLALMNYGWPGNVRELRNVMERLVVLADDGMIQAAHLPYVMQKKSFAASEPVPARAAGPQGGLVAAARDSRIEPMDLTSTAKEARRAAILAALEASGGNRSVAAQRLGVSRSAFYYQMKQLKLV